MTQLRGIASTLRMRTAISPEQWQPWTAKLFWPCWASSAWHSQAPVRTRKFFSLPGLYGCTNGVIRRSCVVWPTYFKLGFLKLLTYFFGLFRNCLNYDSLRWSHTHFISYYMSFFPSEKPLSLEDLLGAVFGSIVGCIFCAFVGFGIYKYSKYRKKDRVVVINNIYNNCNRWQ